MRPQMTLCDAGDELQLRHTCAGAELKPWKANGIVVRLADASEEVTVEMRGGKVSAAGSASHLWGTG